MEAKKKEEEEFQEGVIEGEELDSDLEREIKAGEWKRLREFATYRKRSRQGKIIATHKALSNRLKELETLFYQLVRDHPEKTTKLLTEIKRLKFLQEYLLQALIWEEQGQLEDHDTPGELEDLF